MGVAIFLIGSGIPVWHSAGGHPWACSRRHCAGRSARPGTLLPRASAPPVLAGGCVYHTPPCHRVRTRWFFRASGGVCFWVFSLSVSSRSAPRVIVVGGPWAARFVRGLSSTIFPHFFPMLNCLSPPLPTSPAFAVLASLILIQYASGGVGEWGAPRPLFPRVIPDGLSRSYPQL